ncbi:MAG TPA: hypothetical protein VNO31_54745, partial [Umezawaea sp.]|nr:hypothetical protein [Umezawaea sp.]
YRKMRYRTRWVRHVAAVKRLNAQARRRSLDARERFRNSLRLDIWADWTSLLSGPRGGIALLCGNVPEGSGFGQKCAAIDRAIPNAYRWGFDRLVDVGWSIGTGLGRIGRTFGRGLRWLFR